VPGLSSGQELKLDERPAEPGEWGYRPAAGAVSQVNPPSFSWRPQKETTWEIECARDARFRKVEYRVKNLKFTVHCPEESQVYCSLSTSGLQAGELQVALSRQRQERPLYELEPTKKVYYCR